MLHLLVVDDDRRLRELLVKFLKEHGYRVSSASSAPETRAFLTLNSVDLMILDIMMPGEDGLALTTTLRHQGHKFPIFFLSAKDSVEERILGLERGGDDYLTKPFDPHELLARLRAIFRRLTPEDHIGLAKSTDSLSFGGQVFFIQEGTLKEGDTIIPLSSTELTLLKTLAQCPRSPLSREELAQRIGHRVEERSVDVQITRLRRKLKDNPKEPQFIQTVRHIGYALYPDL